MTLSVYMAMADAEVAERRESPFFGVTQDSAFGLRALQRYHKDALADYPIAGKLRSLTHKQAAMLGVVARLSISGETKTMTAIAKEANVVPSTVSRFLLKLQCWNAYAIDVTRGRHGGVRVRLRTIGDQLAAYAERAWLRIKKAAEKAVSRTKRNVASISTEDVRGTSTSTTPMDATFSGGTARGCLVRGCNEDHPAATSVSFTMRDAIAERDRAEAWAQDVLRERARLAIEDPFGELDAEYPIGWARALRYGVG